VAADIPIEGYAINAHMIKIIQGGIQVLVLVIVHYG